jgi:hypothetical protein
MDKKEINSPRMTADFLIGLGASFVANKSGPLRGHDSKRQGILEGYVRKGDAWSRSASQNGGSGNVESDGRE